MQLPKDPINGLERELEIKEIFINPVDKIIRLKFEIQWLNPDGSIFMSNPVITTITRNNVAEYIDGEQEDEKIPVYLYDKLVNQKVPGTDISIYDAIADMLENYISENLETIIGGN